MSLMHRWKIKVLVLLLLSVLAAGCSLLPSEPPTFPASIGLSSNREVGQTFVAGWDGLNGLSVYITPAEKLPKTLLLSLYDRPDSESPLWTGEVQIAPDQVPGWFNLPIETQRSSAGNYYFLAIGTDSQGHVELSTAPVNFYTEGSLYLNRLPQQRHLEYRLQYSIFWAAAGLVREIVPAAGLLAAFSFLFTLPGWALFSSFWARWPDQPVHNRWLLASGLGLSVYPILLLWARLVRLELLPLLVWTVPLGAAASFAWRFWKGTWRPSIPFVRLDLPAVVFYGSLLLLLATRLIPLRTLEAGMWGDSYHHTLIAQLLIENGGLFSTWEPYAPLITFTYHFGFHTSAALLSLLTGSPSQVTILQMGQLVNFLAVAGLVPLSGALLIRFRRNGITSAQQLWIGTFVVVTAGLLAPIPMFNINWGRYTQLAGQALLVLWMAYSLDFFRAEKRSWQTDLLSWLLLAGIGLTHYRVLVFAVLWVPAYWLVSLNRQGLWRLITGTWRAGYGAVLMILPWLVIVFGGGLLAILQFQLTTPPEALGEALDYYNRVGRLTTYLPTFIWAACAVIIVWALARRSKAALVLVIWSGLLLLLANPSWLGLPGTGVVNNFAALLAVYIPAALLVGMGGLWLADILFEHVDWFRTPEAVKSASLLLLLVAGAGAVQELDLVNPRGHAMVTHSDRMAYEWVQENVTEDAGFFVNFFTAEGGNAVAGSDGGWWLPYFTGRDSVLPPFIMISEVTKPRDLRVELLELDAWIREQSLDHQKSYEQLRMLGVTHLYFGQRQGRVGSQGVFVDPVPLLDSRFYTLVYQQDHVWIFELIPEPPG